MASKLTLPKTCPGDHLLLVAVSTKYSNKNVKVSQGDTMAFQTAEGQTLTQPQAIAAYLLKDTDLLADKTIDGKDYQNVRNAINEYVGIATNLITPNLAKQTYPLFSARAPEKSKPGDGGDGSQKIVAAILEDINSSLQLNTFLAAERLTLADLAVASSLTLAYRSGLKTPAGHRHITRWFKTIAFQKEFIKAQGPSGMTEFPGEALKFDGKTFAQIQKEIKNPTKPEPVAEALAPSKQEPTVPEAGDAPALSDKAAAKKAKKEADKAAKLAKLQAKKDKLAAQGPPKPSQKDTKKAPTVIVSATYDVIHETAGEKKSTTCELPNSYSPKYCEAQWYQWWEAQGYFKPEHGRETVSEPNPNGMFMICIPPPNVTGKLHLGHALTSSIQDSLTRWHRMHGKTVLWNPGCDHAGIATQVVVEKKLAREQGLSRHDLGRAKFLEHVWDWKNEFGGAIYNQIRQLGASCDWDRSCFTMDPKMVRAVEEAFIRMHESGTIFRSARLVNWSTRLNSAISNLEVDKKEISGRTFVSVPGYDEKVEVGVLIFFSYKVENSDREIIVATTRIETMLGDVAIAVHPEDERYKDYIGKYAVHPFVEGRRLIIVADDYVDKDFGTGAVKITPAHDPNDFEIGKRHNLENINIFTDDGLVCETGTEYDGMKRFDVRKKIVNDLKTSGSYKETKDNPMVVPFCSRSKDIIEPMIKAQWFVNTDTMAKRSVDAVRNGDLLLHPKTFEKTWYHWLETPQDWCISRQLWWGHRIPAYYIQLAGKERTKAKNADGKYWVIGRSAEEAQKNAAAKFPGKQFTLEQDEDVLDTWFSSGIFPFSIFGWPDETEDLKTFYPGSLLETGHDILFFWVARMVMFGFELTDQLPFKEVYLHAMVRDAHGRKMSKSIGNTIDPVWVINGIPLDEMKRSLRSGNLPEKEVEKAMAGQESDFPKGIPECGADAMRFALCAYTAQCRDINLDVQRVVGWRKFCNKLWNAIKFATIYIETYKPKEVEARKPFSASAVDQWILSRLSACVDDTHTGFSTYNFPQVTTALHQFWLYDLCDVYLEAVKPVFRNGTPVAQADAKETLFTCLENGLRLLAPIMPFLSEELWQRLPKRGSEKASVHISTYPRSTEWAPFKNASNIEDEFEKAMDCVKSVRSLRAEYGLTPKQNPEIFIKSSEKVILGKFELMIETLGNGQSVSLADEFPEGCAIGIVDATCDVGVMLKGIIDVDREITKLSKEMEKEQKRHTTILAKIAKPGYVKAKAEAKAKDQETLESIGQKLAKMQITIDQFSKMK